MSDNRRLLHTSHSDEVSLHGKMLPAGTGTPTFKGNWISSIARNGIGDYTVTVKNEYKYALARNVCILVSVHSNTGTLKHAVSADVSGATFKIFVYDAANPPAVNDMAADVDNFVGITVVGKRSSVIDGSGVT